MRWYTLMLAFLGLSVALVGMGQAGGPKEIAIKGNICCAKCELGISDTCYTVISAKKDGKDQVYYFDAPTHKKYHDDICGAAKTGTVYGTVKYEGKKAYVTVKKLAYD